jgi:hypothetical protein
MSYPSASTTLAFSAASGWITALVGEAIVCRGFASFFAPPLRRCFLERQQQQPTSGIWCYLPHGCTKE